MLKKGVVNLIVIVLVILLILFSFLILSKTFNKIIGDKSAEITGGSLNCILDVDIDILSVCYNENFFDITIKNKNDVILGDFFLIELYKNNGEYESIPTPFNTYIDSYETKTIMIPFVDGINKIKVIPKIESQVFLCSGLAPEYNGIKECEDE